MDKRNKTYTACKMAASTGFILSALLNYRASGSRDVFVIMMPALVFCWLGDLFLALSDELNNLKKNPEFTLGVAFFACAQILFCIEIKKLTGSIGILPLLCMAAAPLFVTFMRKKGGFSCEPYTVPVTIYSVLIGGLLGFSVRFLMIKGSGSGNILIGAGGVLFFISDLCLSFRNFSDKKNAFVSLAVLPTYYAATYMFSFYI
jgi:hypothetical protein